MLHIRFIQKRGTVDREAVVARPSSAKGLANLISAKSRKPLRSFWRDVSRAARALKTGPVSSEEKNRLWWVQVFADATEIYLDAYRLMARGKYYEGWCELERAENAFARLLGNQFLMELVPIAESRAELVALWQSVFPYKYFASPGMRYKKWKCSICGKQSTPVEPCGHIIHRVYEGQLCYRIILEAEPTHVAIVTDPVQKYSVLQPDNDYSVVQYVLDHLTGPFHPWDGEWTHKRHPHDKFSDRAPDGPCPCESRLRYSECCMLQEGVRLPHFQMTVTRGATRAGPLEDKFVLHPDKHKVQKEGERTFRVNLLRAAE